MKTHAMRLLYGSIPVAILVGLAYLYHELGIDEDILILVGISFVAIYAIGWAIDLYRKGYFKDKF